MDWLNNLVSTFKEGASAGAEIYKTVTGTETENKVTQQVSGAESAKTAAEAQAAVIWPWVVGAVGVVIGLGLILVAFRRPAKG